jgi:hypothetical protein
MRLDRQALLLGPLLGLGGAGEAFRDRLAFLVGEPPAALELDMDRRPSRSQAQRGPTYR